MEKEFSLFHMDTWPYYPSSIPLDKEGNGPVHQNIASGISYVVYHRESGQEHGRYSELGDAIDHSMSLNSYLINS